MGTVIAWIAIFAIICGCIFAWSYMLHRGPHAGENDEQKCDGNCTACAINAMKKMECNKNEKND
ncbi:MAG: hypothetical protein K5639_05190 [Eubacterium sp.]|nr:hypothetical protein [Eubacterium sp.]